MPWSDRKRCVEVVHARAAFRLFGWDDERVHRRMTCRAENDIDINRGSVACIKRLDGGTESSRIYRGIGTIMAKEVNGFIFTYLSSERNRVRAEHHRSHHV